MTKPVTRKMAVDCLLDRVGRTHGTIEFDGILRLRCVECGDPLLPGQNIHFDHIHGDAMGGPHEYQNLRPIHYDPCHKKKTKCDVQSLAKVDRILGLTCNGPKKKIPSRPFQKRKTRCATG